MNKLIYYKLYSYCTFKIFIIKIKYVFYNLKENYLLNSVFNCRKRMVIGEKRERVSSKP